MSRIARVVIPGIPHHITQRGNHRETVFFSDDARTLYLTTLAAHAQRYGARIPGFCLMSNHVHFGAVPEKPDSLAKAFGRTHNDHARWLHVRHGRAEVISGRTAYSPVPSTLAIGRFHSSNYSS